MGGRREPTRSGRKRGLILAGLIGAGVLVLAAGAGGAWWLLSGPPEASQEPEPVAEAPARPAPRPTRVVSFNEGCATAECHAAYLADEGVHEPVAQGSCSSCHLPDAGGHVYPVPAPARESCAACHDIGGRHTFRHAAMTDDGCLACHDPHASDGHALLTRETIPDTCTGCHPGSGGLVRHEPYAMGECISCHDPHAEDNRLLLHGGEGAGHCGLCHQATVEAMSESRHNPQRLGGDCLMCHTAHTSEWPGLLSDRSGDQCLRCHAEVRETIDASLVAHQGAMTDRHCVTCHAPHASPEMAMLRDDQATVCLACHDEPVEAVDGRTIPDMTPTILEAENVHGPVDHGHCSLCHSVHGSQFPRLLNDLNPEVVIGPFDLRNYGLCFQCHDQGLVTDPETTTATDFRHAGINLHHLHVENKGRGRACSTCHVVHGGNRPRLMADFASFEGGGWKMPLGFTLTDRGGNCAPGCHEPRSYVNTTGGNE